MSVGWNGMEDILSSARQSATVQGLDARDEDKGPPLDSDNPTSRIPQCVSELSSHRAQQGAVSKQSVSLLTHLGIFIRKSLSFFFYCDIIEHHL